MLVKLGVKEAAISKVSFNAIWMLFGIFSTVSELPMKNLHPLIQKGIIPSNLWGILPFLHNNVRSLYIFLTLLIGAEGAQSAEEAPRAARGKRSRLERKSTTKFNRTFTFRVLFQWSSQKRGVFSYLFNSLTIWLSSFNINLFIASLTAPDDPGITKMALFWYMPAVARDKMAADPMSSK